MAVTVTYQLPVSGTTPPTAAQVAAAVNATVAWADADTTALVTHNFGLSNAEITALFPLVDISIDSSSAGTVNGVITTARTSNVLTLAKASAAGSGGTFIVQLLRSHSLIR
jgi:hypothetical protein